MAVSILVEALLSSGEGRAVRGKPPTEDEKAAKEWLKNKLKALALLIGKLGMKTTEALPGIIGAIISWILNRAKEVVGWVAQNLWTLVITAIGLAYTYIMTEAKHAKQ